MEKKYMFKHLVFSFLAGSIFFSGLSYAASQNIEVSFDKLKFIVNGVDKSSADGQFDNNGTKVPESLIYNGTTYIPMRMVGTMLGESVDWDGNERAVIIGEAIGKGDYLSNLQVANATGLNSVILNKEMEVENQTYNNGIEFGISEGTATYNLNNKYKSLHFLLGFKGNVNGRIEIIGDGKSLFLQELVPGSKPQDVNIDLTGVLQLEIKKSGYGNWVDMINPFLISV